jgi:hypothetical protein
MVDALHSCSDTAQPRDHHGITQVPADTAILEGKIAKNVAAQKMSATKQTQACQIWT